MFAALRGKLMLDRAVILSLLGQMIRLVTGPATLLLVLRYLGPVEQGYYYTFQGVLGLSILLELGFAQNIVQFTAHEASALNLGPDRTVTGKEEPLSRVSSLARLSLKYYSIAAVLFALLVGGGGLLFFKDGGLATGLWKGPWIWIVLSSSCSLLFTPCWALLEGFNRYAEVAAFRLQWSALVFAALAGGLLFGLKLWALALSGVLGTLYAGFVLGRHWWPFFRSLLTGPLPFIISWKKEIWPFQWRIGLSWLSGYFIFTYIIPVIFKVLGPEEAGRFGVTLQLVKLISTLSLTWISTKSASLSMLVAGRSWRELDVLWKKTTWFAMVFVILGSAALMIASIWLRDWVPTLAGRLASTTVTGLLVASTIISTLLACMGILLRAHKKDPFVLISCAAALLALFLCPYLAERFHSAGGAMGYLLASALVLPAGMRIFIKKTKEYRMDPNP